jgi:hypothetical protein
MPEEELVGAKRKRLEQQNYQPDQFATKDRLGVELFTIVFFSVLGLTLVCLAVGVYLSTNATPSESVKAMQADVMTMFKLGCGAIIGMLGGKQL